MEKQGTGSNAPSPKYSPRSRNASLEWTRWNHERAGGNHEWTRMDTNGQDETTNGWEGTTKNTKSTKNTRGGSRTTNEHQWTRMGITSCNNLMFFQMI